MGSPNIPEPIPAPATRPERRVDVEAEQIQFGGEGKDPSRPKGKKQLIRPAGSAVVAGAPSAGLVA
ncbi:MAG: hypothetical protein ACRC0J_14720 [Shewanella oncorhynchi]